MPRPTRKTTAVGAAVLLGVSVCGGAYAYWTNAGSGTGTASTGTTVALVVNQAPVTPLYPGSTQVLSGTFDNPNDGPTYVTAVTATGYTIDAASVAAGCTVAGGHYTLGGTATVGADVPAGTAVGAWSGLTITMNNLGTNQDFCKNAVLTISYESS